MTRAARRRMVTCFLYTASLLACAGSPRMTGRVSPDARLAMRDVVTAAELRRGGTGQNLLAALQQTRPGFLMARGAVPMASVDGGPVTEIGALQLIPVGDVREIRFVRATTGTSRSAVLPNGSVVVGDVLLVLTRTR